MKRTAGSLRRIVFLVLLVVFLLPAIKRLARGEEDHLVTVVTAAFGLVPFLLLMLFFSLVRRGLRSIDRTPDPAATPTLPPDAFCVRIDYFKANILAVLLTLVTIVPAWLTWRLVWDINFDLSLLLILYLVILILLHELSHAVGWLVCGVPVRSLRFGVLWQYLAPYAHCSVPTSMRTYRIALALPLVTTGIAPFVLGLHYLDPDLVLAGSIMIGGAGGDLLMLAAGTAFHSDTRVMDHPHAPAFIVLEKGNLPDG